MNPRRRELIRLAIGAGALAGTGAMLGCARPARRAQPRVVVVGGGYGGAGCAKYLKYLDPSVRVTLVEPKTEFITCPFSNLYIGGLIPWSDLIRSHDPLARDYGINLVRARADRIDPERRILHLNNGGNLGYDRLVVSPGVEMHWNAYPAGYTEAAANRMPHAWTGGTQTRLLRSMLENMKNGGLVVITVPPAPFRCPPGPYERASLFAWYLKNHKPRSRVLILDANTHFSKEDLFMEAWETRYPGMIEHRPVNRGGLVTGVEPGRGVVFAQEETIRADVANVIPSHGAGALARDNDLVDDTGWCPVDHLTFESTRVSGVHVLGDSCLAGPMPKSASSANSQAKACALALIALLRGEEPVAGVYHNTCYSLAAGDYGFSINGMYRYENGRITLIERAGGLSPLKASAGFRQREARNARDWYDSINADTFGIQ